MTTTKPTNPASTLPDGWQVVRFDQMAENIAVRVDDPSAAGVERYVGLEHLDPESLKLRRWGKPEDVEATKLRFWPGDIIFGRRRAYQRKLAVADFEGICSAHALVLRAREDIVEKDFLPFFMQSDIFYERALAISVGSLSPTINWKTLAEQQFAIPPKDEQRRIAEILWAADDAIQSWSKVLDSLDRTVSILRESVICDPAFPRQPLRNCLLRIVAGKSVLGVTEPALEDQVGVLKVSAVGGTGFVAIENKRLIDPGDFRPEFSVKAGDMLITRANTRELVGRVCLVTADYPRLMLCDKTLRLDVDESKALKPFLLEALQSKEARDQIESSASGTGSAMKNIGQETIRSLLVPLPTVDKQARILHVQGKLQAERERVFQHVKLSAATACSLREACLQGSVDSRGNWS
jgi:type I restriction enzyme S subunit